MVLHPSSLRDSLPPAPIESDIRALRRLSSFAPARGEELASVPILGESEVRAHVARARAAAPGWAALGHAKRRALLLAYRRELAKRVDALAELIHSENGKTRGDAYSEVFGTCGLLDFAAKNAERVLKSRRVSSGPMMMQFRSELHYEPLGVVGVIGPWNMPLMTPMGSIASALAAGNCVVFKPSELTPLCGQALVDAAQGILPEGVLQAITGDGSTGAALAEAAVDKLAFTGSTATGKKVMAAAARRLTPVVMELGGKDPMIVTADADLEDAVKHAVFGSLALTGQACISIERIYVERPIYEQFVARVIEEAKAVRAGDGAAAHIGAMTRVEQLEIIRSHVIDALQKGARPVVGGLDSIGNPFMEPIVLVDVDHDMLIMREETFGPVLCIMAVDDTDQAVELANQTSYGLGASVFGGKQAFALARRLRAGMTAVNSVWAPVAIHGLPFGGVGDSGFGRIHGDEGIREFSRIQATATARKLLGGSPLKFGDPSKAAAQFKLLTQKVYGGQLFDRVGGFFRALGF